MVVKLSYNITCYKLTYLTYYFNSYSFEMAVFWIVGPYSLVEIHLCFRDTFCLHHQGDSITSKHLWNVGKLLPVYTAQQLGRQPSSFSPPWEP
jgi:hypothetical protein